MELASLLGSLFALIGAALLVQARRLLRARRAFLRRACTAVGEIVALIDRGTGMQRSFHPQVRFTTAEGREITFESNMGSESESRQAGERVSVRYLPDRPGQAELATHAALWGPTVLFSLLGVVFLGVGLGALSGAIPV